MLIAVRNLDGLVRCVFSGPYSFTSSRLKVGKSYFPYVSSDTHSIVEVKTVPALFSEDAYTYSNGVWTVADQARLDMRLSEVKARKKAEVNAFRDQKMFEDFTYNGAVYQADKKSQDRIEKARTSALTAIVAGAQENDLRWHQQPVDFYWITKANTRVLMDAQSMAAFGAAVAAREGLLIARGSDLKNQIDNAADYVALDAIDLNAGWPG